VRTKEVKKWPDNNFSGIPWVCLQSNHPSAKEKRESGEKVIPHGDIPGKTKRCKGGQSSDLVGKTFGLSAQKRMFLNQKMWGKNIVKTGTTSDVYDVGSWYPQDRRPRLPCRPRRDRSKKPIKAEGNIGPVGEISKDGVGPY